MRMEERREEQRKGRTRGPAAVPEGRWQWVKRSRTAPATGGLPQTCPLRERSGNGQLPRDGANAKRLGGPTPRDGASGTAAGHGLCWTPDAKERARARLCVEPEAAQKGGRAP